MNEPITVTTIDNTEMKNLDNEICIKMIEQSLEGVMFHLFQVDLYDLLELKGFKKMHQKQVEEESQMLECLKHKYINTFNKIPHLKIKNSSFWENSTELNKNMSKEDKIKLIKNSMKQYADWESSVLENLFKWKRNTLNRSTLHEMIKDVMEELERVETLIQILEEHNFSYDAILEISDYLYKKI